MRILAFDPSINRTGWCVIEDGARLNHGVIRTRGGSDAERCGEIVKAVKKLGQHVDLAVVEVPAGWSYARSTTPDGRSLNTRSLGTLNRAVGAIFAGLSIMGIPVVEVEPSVWKGTRSKAEESFLARASGAGNAKHDEADAIGIADWWWRIGRRAA